MRYAPLTLTLGCTTHKAHAPAATHSCNILDFFLYISSSVHTQLLMSPALKQCPPPAIVCPATTSMTEFLLVLWFVH